MNQDAIAILWSLIALGITRIYLGPVPPAWANEGILEVLTNRYGIRLIGDPKEDINEMLGYQKAGVSTSIVDKVGGYTLGCK